MPSNPPTIGADTAATCWLCDRDRDRGELCRVHAPRTDDYARAGPVVVNLPEAGEAAP